MPSFGTAILTALAMFAFSANSLLCRLALKETAIDAASFTTIRLSAGALALWMIVFLRHPQEPAPGRHRVPGSWGSALALFAYACAFSFAYLKLTAATGALLLFGTVQATMFGFALWRGERVRGPRLFGLACALAGLIGLLLPGLQAPPLRSALLMAAAGMAWGIYSLRAKGSGDPTAVTAGNFLRTLPFALGASALAWPWMQFDAAGAGYAVLSGAIASGVGYAIWYAALPGLRASSAATVQLSVPLLAAAGGVLMLAEPLTLRLIVAAAAILGGIALVLFSRPAK